MGLREFVDVAKDYSDKIRKRIREQGVDASLRDIEDELRELIRRDNSRIRCRLVKTQLLELYQQDATLLEKDITKFMILDPASSESNISASDSHRLLGILFPVIKKSLNTSELDSVVSDIHKMSEAQRKV